jgi:hypothetical protein
MIYFYLIYLLNEIEYQFKKTEKVMKAKTCCYILILIILSQISLFSQTIQYTLIAENPHRHVFQVRIDYQLEDEPYLNIAMPAWNPGDYRIQNMAKNVFEVKAVGDRGKVKHSRDNQI